ncbi:MAG TPA: (4Fe-4S)-binding protein [Methanothrix sp.]|nr:(4Fe-4S)-binding protein [Methanothrix sp.]HPT19755.1 (4Fe-4S)-binding protein [Methanothrix sp.]
MKIYSNEEISVVWCPEKCIHARECVRGLPEVFSRDRSPWIDMSKASSEEIIEVVGRCPSGALTCKDKSDDSNESNKSVNARNEDDMMASEGSGKAQIKLMKNGPLLVEGGAALLDSAGNVLAKEGTYALCRCGGSKKKPFCDGTHSKIGFDDTK